MLSQNMLNQTMLNDILVMAALPFPEIDPVLFSVGIFSVRWYALAYIGGLLLGWGILRWLVSSPEDSVSKGALDDLVNFGLIGIILGGRLGYVFGYNALYYLQNPIEIFYIWQGGMSFHGGFLGMVLSVIFVARRHRIRILALGDLVALVAPIGLFLGRVTNFINGELYGRVTDVPWAFVFPGGGDLPRHPSQLYEAVLEGFVLFVILAVAYRYGARQRPGLMLGLFMTCYASFRILVEFFREPDSHLGFIFSDVTMGQILSLPMLGIGIYILVYAYRKAS